MNRLLFLFLLSICSTWVSAQSTSLSKNQMTEDLEFLKSNLLQRHPNLFTYNTPEAFDQFFADLISNLPEQASELTFYQMLTPISTLIKDGHTLIYPGKERLNYHQEQSSFFPFQIHWDGKTLYTLRNFSSDEEIPDGSQILSINGQSSSEIMAYIQQRIMQDGNNTTYPFWVSNNWFTDYYSFFNGHPSTFKIKFKYPDGVHWIKDIPALPKKAIAKKRRSLYPTYAKKKKEETTAGKGITLQMMSTNKSAILNIKSFDNSLLKKVYQQAFKKTIKGLFATIEAEGVQNLILDLRGNQGGAIKNGQALLSYLMTQDFQLVEGYKKVGDHTNKNPQDRLKDCKGPAEGTHPPKSNAFTGQLYVLTDGGSFSNSGIVCAALKRKNRAIFIGEETGGSKNILAGNIKNLDLPNSKIQLQIPTLQFLLDTQIPVDNYSGVVPDHLIQAGITNLMDERDVVLEFALKLIQQNGL